MVFLKEQTHAFVHDLVISVVVNFNMLIGTYKEMLTMILLHKDITIRTALRDLTLEPAGFLFFLHSFKVSLFFILLIIMRRVRPKVPKS